MVLGLPWAVDYLLMWRNAPRVLILENHYRSLRNPPLVFSWVYIFTHNSSEVHFSNMSTCMSEFLFPFSFSVSNLFIYFSFPLPFKWRRMISPLILIRKIHVARPYIIFSCLFIVFSRFICLCEHVVGVTVAACAWNEKWCRNCAQKRSKLKTAGEADVNNNSEQ